MAEIANAEAMREAYPDREATPSDDAAELVKQPSPRAFLTAAWDEGLHPREGGRFTFKDDTDSDTKTKSDAGNKASELEMLATQTDYGDVDPPDAVTGFRDWGKTTDSEAWNAAHEEAVAVVGEDVAHTVEGWSYGGSVGTVREAYAEYRSSGDTSTNSNASEFRDDLRSMIEQEQRGAQGFFEMLDANRVDVTLHRGLSAYETEELRALKPGDELPDQLASWSRDPLVAEVFRDANVRYSDTATRINMTLEPGAHGVDISTLGAEEFAWQEEVVVGGPLVVTSVESKPGRLPTEDLFITVKAAT
jgi:hypothetical protein